MSSTSSATLRFWRRSTNTFLRPLLARPTWITSSTCVELPRREELDCRTSGSAFWTEEKFNFEPKMKKPFWKQMSKNFIERYCYLVVFATYLRERAPRGFDSSFTLWMDIRAEIREIISNGSKNFNFM